MSPTTRVSTLLSYTIVFLLGVFILWPGIPHMSVRDTLGCLLSSSPNFSSNLKDLPDFGQYVHLATISGEELDLEHRRLIIIGDIHGMKSSVDNLLETLSYTSSDLLIHLGDTIIKGPDSLSILQQFTDANVRGVRGNHEQAVIEWRGWIEWVESQKGGVEWLEESERSAKRRAGVWMTKFQNKHLEWPIPKGWKFMGEHYMIARSMDASHYSYLKSLPLVIHLPSLHTHLVHAGILPFDPQFSPTSSGQPLAHVPKSFSSPPTSHTRTAQEIALLTDVSPNTDPWVLLNMRSVLDSNRVSRKWKHSGTPWSDLWDMTIKRCKGYDPQIATRSNDMDSAGSFRLHCLPISVIYGHAAGRGLDIKRWSFGLDTGCAYGRNITAMVISNSNTSVSSVHTQRVLFGDSGTAELISISCST